MDFPISPLHQPKFWINSSNHRSFHSVILITPPVWAVRQIRLGVLHKQTALLLLPFCVFFQSPFVPFCRFGHHLSKTSRATSSQDGDSEGSSAAFPRQLQANRNVDCDLRVLRRMRSMTPSEFLIF